ncbi:solute carrier family 35, member F1/2 [Entomortierella parvispora]|uniref:Solute carrier family 35, member F1/2 n=1 Tax=Entomortierella parvispora TaxID=205924 RepID=A0A9P3HAY2_9FUNG|nr:solute carrier family 35, member F1/2 [Entomortierella parvispora]
MSATNNFDQKMDLQEQQLQSSGALAADSTTPVAEPETQRAWHHRVSGLFTRKFIIILLLGQLLSLCITATTIFTTYLAQGANPVSIPTTQSFLNYFVLAIVYTAITLHKEGFRGWLKIMRRRAHYYILLALVDVEGNYFVVKCYNYTSLLSAMLLDAWTIPCVVLLSVFFLKMRFRHLHYVGVVVSLVGMGFLIWSDMEAGMNSPGSDYVKGDILCIIGATLYAFSNVGQEYLVRQRPVYEVVGQLGFWGAIINGIQLAILERQELQNIHWDGKVVGYIIGFDIAMFLMYSVSPILFRLSSATFFNLSLLTSDFYGLLFGLFLFNATINKIYPIAYTLIIVGIVIYNVYPGPEPNFRPILSKEEEEAMATKHEDETIV